VRRAWSPTPAHAERAFAGAKVDFCVRPAAGRRKRLLVVDMDSTIIGSECLDELADFAGIEDERSFP
jgi:phosphoserine phosphatase